MILGAISDIANYPSYFIPISSSAYEQFESHKFCITFSDVPLVPDSWSFEIVTVFDDISLRINESFFAHLHKNKK